ncbi:hypothetical protein QR680_018570 [Steinernema hermaphroditum]|uniref:non-specific protein-tyrosine kinase n=1 Tax=Steinernema hermaphroditum TaxID=289476 RepID=A0AA39HKQ1_9BILA|nr:hypothetical protein QR680_018570 [Steinernema hermaphroditum]
MESASGGDVLIEEALLDVLRETDLLCYQKKLYVGLQLTRIEHFDHATDDDLIQLGGLAPPSARRLREALERKKKTIAKKKLSIFANSNGKPLPGTNMVPVPKKEAGWLDAPEPSSAELSGSGSTSLIKPEDIKLMERLGEGTFATVKRAIWSCGQRKVDVAVKILKDVSADVMEDLLLEVSNMQKLQHPNLIKLYGIVFARPTMMVTELCNGGALLDRLRAQNKPLVLMTTLVDYAQQIAKGMTYLESKHCVHRDLATRNVLLTDNDKTIKICDFGLMRCLDDTERLYVMSAPKKVPFSWCPPESLRYRQFSHASDVWAFGVTLWELFTYGEEPWVGYRAADVLKMTESGERLRKPERASKELDSIMRMCWELKPEKRPKFSLLTQLLKEIHFYTAECTTVLHAVNDGDLALNPTDKVIVVDGSHSTTWFGQNVTSKLFGRFEKSAVTVRSRQVERPAQEQRISRPLKGSFVHTGHGDVRGGMSWGHPDKIDDIYLKNPVLKPLNDDSPRRVGATVIPTLQEVSQRAPTTSTRTASVSPPKPAPAPKPKELSPPRHANGRIKRNTISDFPVLPTSQPPPLPSIPPKSNGAPRPLPTVHSTGHIQAPSTVKGPSLSELAKQKEVLSKIDSELMNQMTIRRKITDASTVLPRPSSGARLMSNAAQMKPTSVTPPPIRATDFSPASTTQESFVNRQKMVSNVITTNGNVQQRPKTGTSDIRPLSALLPQNSGPDPFEVPSEIRNLAERDRYNDMFRSQTLSSRQPAAQSSSVAAALNLASSVVQNRTPNAPFTTGTIPRNPSTPAYNQAPPPMTTVSPRTTSTAPSQAAPPSRVQPVVSTVSTAPGPSYLQPGPVPSSWNNPGPSTSRGPPPPASGPPIAFLPSYTQALAMPSGLPPPSSLLLSGAPNSTAPTPAYPAPNYNFATSSCRSSCSSSSGSSYASSYGYAAPNGVQTAPPQIGFISQPPPAPVDGELLALFDPLAAGPANPPAPSRSQSQAPQITQAVIDEVHRYASFASKSKCEQTLRKCHGDKQKAVQELKIGSLLEMGLVADKTRATAALQQSNWDLNAAAALLLPS